MSARNKCSRDEADMLIKLTADDPLQAESFIIRTFSSVARGLPADATEFNVSELLLDGQPYSKETIQCWLNCGRRTVYGPAELEAVDISMLSTVHQLHQVLSFAQAVGSPDGLLTAACSQLSSLKFELPLPQLMLQMPMSGCYLIESDTDLQQFDLKFSMSFDLASKEELMQVKRELATQTGKLLHMAHVLRLPPLIGAVHDFLFNNTTHDMGTPSGLGVFYGMLELVLTDAVIDAALGSSTISKEAYLSSILMRPCSFTTSTLHSNGLFKPISAISSGGVRTTRLDFGFEAELLQDFFGAKSGEKVTVGFDIFDEQPTLMVDSGIMTYPVQLLLGTQISIPQEFADVMNSRLQS